MIRSGELRRSAPAVRVALLACAALCSSCIASYQTVPWVNTQRHPRPMRAPADLPPGVSERWRAGPEVVQVVRLSDPVHIVRPGIVSSYPLNFWEKTARVSSGSGVHVAAGGRAEIVWDHGTRLLLRGPSSGVLGSQSRGEPCFVLGEVERAILHPSRPEELWLVGGARLSALGGPVVIERVGPEVLCVSNQSDSPLALRYRDQFLELDPGQLVDLAVLREGSAPFGSSLGWEELRGLGFPARVAGSSHTSTGSGALRVEAEGPLEVEALGVRVTLAAGERALLARLGASEPPPAALPAPPAEPGASESAADEPSTP